MTSEAAHHGAVGYHRAPNACSTCTPNLSPTRWREGRNDGTLTSSDPYVDARSVLAIVDIVILSERVLTA